MNLICRILSFAAVTLLTPPLAFAATQTPTKETCDVLRNAAQEICGVLFEAGTSGSVHLGNGGRDAEIRRTHLLCNVVKSWFGVQCPSIPKSAWSDPFLQDAKPKSAPAFVAAVASSQGMARLDLTEALAEIPLPSSFPGWMCYIDETQRQGPAYVKQISCGSKAGSIDGFVSCSPLARESTSVVRLRQPFTGSKAASQAAEKVTISVSCEY